MTDEQDKQDLMVLAANVAELMQHYFWTDIIKPQFDIRLSSLDTEMRTTNDPWKRYGLVEAYSKMVEFRLWFDDIIEQTKKGE